MKLPIIKILIKSPITKIQDTNNIQISITNHQTCQLFLVWILEFDNWSLFGYCILMFGYLPLAPHKRFLAISKISKKYNTQSIGLAKDLTRRLK